MNRFFHAQPYSATCPHPFFFRVRHTVQIRSVEHLRTVGKKSPGDEKAPIWPCFFDLILTRNDKLGVFYHKCVHFMDFV